METAMPYRKILLNAFTTWIQSKVVWLNVLMVWIMSEDFFAGIKTYAVIIGALYTTIKFYKDFVREHEFWLSFKKLSMDMLKKAGIDVSKQQGEADKKEKQ